MMRPGRHCEREDLLLVGDLCGYHDREYMPFLCKSQAKNIILPATATAAATGISAFNTFLDEGLQPLHRCTGSFDVLKLQSFPLYTGSCASLSLLTATKGNASLQSFPLCTGSCAVLSPLYCTVAIYVAVVPPLHRVLCGGMNPVDEAHAILVAVVPPLHRVLCQGHSVFGSWGVPRIISPPDQRM